MVSWRRSELWEDNLLTSCLRSDSGPDDSIAQPTNRGNKMKANAKYVREGAMGYINAEEFYKEVRGIRPKRPFAGPEWRPLERLRN